MSDTTKYMVTAASGQLGALVIDALLALVPSAEIGAMVRREEAAEPLRAKGITVRIGDYTDTAAMTEAFSGVERLLLISSNEIGQRAAQHRNAIAAASAAGVGFVAYTSILRAPESPLEVLAGEHRETEVALAASGLPHALLRNGWYTENYTMGAAGSAERGAMIGAAAEGRISSAARVDYAEAAAVVLTGAIPEAGAIYELAGDDAYRLPTFAAAVAEIAGTPVSYSDLSPEAFEAALIGAGLPAPLAHMLADSEKGAARGGLYSDDTTLSELIQRPTTPWRDTLRAALA